jgi:hypothetical protein
MGEIMESTVATILNFQIMHISHYSELLNGALASWNNQSLLPYCHKKKKTYYGLKNFNTT